MKKVLATLLAVLLTFSVIAVCNVSAEDDAEPAGNVYTWTGGDNPIVALNKADGEVTLLQNGDVIRFDEITAAGATAEKPKYVDFVYHPDAAELSTSQSNRYWKETIIPQYELDTKKWDVDTKNGEAVADYYAKSPNYYKTFLSSASFVKGDSPEITVVGLNADALVARDSEPRERGVAPIDFALHNEKFSNGKFLGWVVSKAVTWSKTSNAKVTIDLYALWDRHPGEEPSTAPATTKPGSDESKVYDNPIAKALDAVLNFIETIRGYLILLPGAVGPVISIFLTGTLKPLLYRLFGVEV